MSVGLLCDGSHEHTRLEGSWTAWSAAYCWGFCLAYAHALQLAPKFLQLVQLAVPVAHVHNFRRVRSLAVLENWPDIPLTYLAGDLEIARQANVLCTGDSVGVSPPNKSDWVSRPTSAPLAGPGALGDAPPAPADLGSAAEEMADKEEEYVFYLKWLAELKAPATKIEYRETRNGECLYIVHFRERVFNLRDMSETLSMQFTATGRHGRVYYGHERAAALAFTAYTAALLGSDPVLRFGCGFLKPNGFHGDARNEFYKY